jgi:hypothetical protein
VTASFFKLTRPSVAWPAADLGKTSQLARAVPEDLLVLEPGKSIETLVTTYTLAHRQRQQKRSSSPRRGAKAAGGLDEAKAVVKMAGRGFYIDLDRAERWESNPRNARRRRRPSLDGPR